MKELQKAKREALKSMGILLVVMALSALWLYGCFFLYPALKHKDESLSYILIGGFYAYLPGFLFPKLIFQGAKVLQSWQNWTNVKNELKNRLPEARVV